jgi:hypothetical protein
MLGLVENITFLNDIDYKDKKSSKKSRMSDRNSLFYDIEIHNQHEFSDE